MKTIEEKARAYDEAIIRAKSLIGDTIIEESGQHIAEVIFPELKESEDEKVIRDIEVVLESSATKFFKEEGKMPIWYDRAIAWLKKQGEQKQDTEQRNQNLQDNSFRRMFECETCDHPMLNCRNFPCDKVKQKPVECMYSKDNYTDEDRKILCDGCQEECKFKSVEWSEEDEDMIQTIDSILFKNGLDKARVWLKSLRPQKQWKPSYEQMNKLCWIANQNKDNMIGKELVTLYEDLKKLSEE